MGMQLNIKSDEAYRLASQLAEATGESLTAVVTKALRETLARREQDREERVKRVLAIAAEMRAEILKHGGSLNDLTTDSLYDEETGLPV